MYWVAVAINPCDFVSPVTDAVFNRVQPAPLALILAIALAIVAAAKDVVTRRVPNKIVLAGSLGGVLLAVLQSGVDGLAIWFAGTAVGSTLLLPGFLLRMTGGGDLKLVAVLGGLLGPRLILHAVMVYYLVGAVWAVAYSLHGSIVNGRPLPFLRLWRRRAGCSTGAAAGTDRCATDQYADLDDGHRTPNAEPVPMAPAIAFGVCAAIWLAHHS